MEEGQEFEFSELTFRTAILDSLPLNISVLDESGKIVAVNKGWREFAAANGMDDAVAGIGVNYFEVCRDAGLDPNARAALEGIRDVIQGRSASFYHRYPCHSATESRWFALRAAPLSDHPSFAVVSHENITERVLARIAGRPSRGWRRSTDADQK